MIEILHRYTGVVLFRSDSADSIKAAVELAAKGHAAANLRGANLRGDSDGVAREAGDSLENSARAHMS